jgi:cation transport regulator ChaB
MPYASPKELPASTRGLPVAARRVFMEAFNGAHAKHGEEAAFKIAWTAVKNAGYTKNARTGKWVKR